MTARVSRARLSRSFTTRPRRSGEPGDAYHFVTREEFEERISRGLFLEWEEFNGNLYGTPSGSVEEGEILVLEIDVKGARSVKRVDPSSLVIALEPPSLGVLEDRMRLRGDPEDHVRVRLKLAVEEMAEARELADLVLINANLEETVERAAAAIAEWASQR